MWCLRTELVTFLQNIRKSTYPKMARDAPSVVNVIVRHGYRRRQTTARACRLSRCRCAGAVLVLARQHYLQGLGHRQCKTHRSHLLGQSQHQGVRWRLHLPVL